MYCDMNQMLDLITEAGMGGGDAEGMRGTPAVVRAVGGLACGRERLQGGRYKKTSKNNDLKLMIQKNKKEKTDTAIVSRQKGNSLLNEEHLATIILVRTQQFDPSIDAPHSAASSIVAVPPSTTTVWDKRLDYAVPEPRGPGGGGEDEDAADDVHDEWAWRSLENVRDSSEATDVLS